MMRIKQGVVSYRENKAVLSTEIDLDNEKREFHLAVDSEYGKFFSPERADYALIGLFVRAMKRNSREIICEAPVTEELLYNIREILIPALLGSDSRYYPIKIQAEMAPPLEKLYCTSDTAGGGE